MIPTAAAAETAVRDWDDFVTFLPLPNVDLASHRCVLDFGLPGARLRRHAFLTWPGTELGARLWYEILFANATTDLHTGNSIERAEKWAQLPTSER